MDYSYIDSTSSTAPFYPRKDFTLPRKRFDLSVGVEGGASISCRLHDATMALILFFMKCRW
jgi:hypothetical protein